MCLDAGHPSWGCSSIGRAFASQANDGSPILLNSTKYLISMELLLIAILAAALLFLGIRWLIETATHHEFKLDAERRTGQSAQQMLFMSSALELNDELTRSLANKMDLRSLEIAKADGRFLVTPADVKQAYEEIIREEHM
jgi:histone H3/H4